MPIPPSAVPDVEGFLRSLLRNVPGAVYRSEAGDEFAMQLVGARSSGSPATRRPSSSAMRGAASTRSSIATTATGCSARRPRRSPAGGPSRRIERDLHDGAQQSLVAVALTLRLAERRLEGAGAEAALVTDARAELEAALDELRELARGIHPAILSDRGPAEALHALATRAPLPVELECDVAERLDPAVEAALYCCAAEALTNAARHARATHVAMRLTASDASVALEVADDGVGGAAPRTGSGLAGSRTVCPPWAASSPSTATRGGARGCARASGRARRPERRGGDLTGESGKFPHIAPDSALRQRSQRRSAQIRIGRKTNVQRTLNAGFTTL